MTDAWLNSDSMGDPAYHASFTDLQHGFSTMPPAPLENGQVVFLMRRLEQGRREVMDEIELSPEAGVPGDAWERLPARKLDAQIAVMQASIARLFANGQSLALFGDCLILDLDLSTANLPAASRVQVGQAVLEVTPLPHTGCLKFRARFGPHAHRFVSSPEHKPRNLRGIYMRVREPGMVRVGDPVRVLARSSLD
jgi:hypothetical protein